MVLYTDKIIFPNEDDMVVGNAVLDNPLDLVTFLVVWGFQFQYYIGAEDRPTVEFADERQLFDGTCNEWPDDMLHGTVRSKINNVITCVP